MSKIYILMETSKIADYTDKKEAEADMDNNSLWYPENSYKIVEQEIE